MHCTAALGQEYTLKPWTLPLKQQKEAFILMIPKYFGMTNYHNPLLLLCFSLLVFFPWLYATKGAQSATTQNFPPRRWPLNDFALCTGKKQYLEAKETSRQTAFLLLAFNLVLAFGEGQNTPNQRAILHLNLKFK